VEKEMKTINGKYHYQVKDLHEAMEQIPQESIVFASWIDGDGTLQERPIYKTVESADPGEVYLYLGDARRKAHSK